MDTETLRVQGARQHNLKNIDLEIPRNKLVVLTGVSGSGKSSLAFDTIYAEGQRRYVESLSPFVRRFLEKVDKPQLDGISGLSPAVAIEQKTVSKNPRSTVGTITEIINYLRLLYSRVGHVHCPACGNEIKRRSATEMLKRLRALPAGTTFRLLVPLSARRGEELTARLARLAAQGYTAVRLAGRIQTIKDVRLEQEREYSVELLVKQDSVPETELDGWSEQLALTIKRALRLSDRTLIVELGQGLEVFLSEELVCAYCGTQVPFLSSQHFSQFSPVGMCPDCHGMGTRMEIDLGQIISDPTLTIRQGALRWYGDMRKKGSYKRGFVESVTQHYGADIDTPWQDLPARVREVILYGSGEERIRIKSLLESSGRTYEVTDSVPGVVNEIARLFRQTTSEHSKRWSSSFMSHQTCSTCQGTGLMAAASKVTLGGLSIIEIGELSIAELRKWLDKLQESLSDEELAIAAEILLESRLRVGFLLDVGLHYLSLNRTAPTLSGGEGQRLRLASQLGSGLTGLLYVLDEPSIGLHARDQQALLKTLLQLRDMGNSVLVVEHDETFMRAADWLIDVGPGAGVAGGNIVAAGTPEEVARHPASLTGRYLRGELRISAPGAAKRRQPTRGWLALEGARLHNLKQVTARFPLGLFICMTGVSGSGKSSLINGTLSPALKRHLHGEDEPGGPFERLTGLSELKGLVNVTQDPIGRTPRSNPATYVGIFDEIRTLFAGTELAIKRGYKADRFSFNVEGGRCETCKGQGQISIEMHFLADVWVPCRDCQGTRFNNETLAVRYQGKHIAEVLAMDVREAIDFFGASPKITRVLQTLSDVGLDYVQLGQSATTFSGGEAQRIKLARELSRQATGRTLYILDEPTTGLHFADVQRLLDVLQRLVERGNTVIVIEHHLDVIKAADWIIDMGPEGGRNGGRIIAEGTPEQVAASAQSYTGKFLQALLA
ncbi:excinuclease ABC subunit UvrA [Ktedonosporobacter rubrisoli]|uniref:UvrABC system protein A n=1 Tax=Ktedonosporobacter rubrisoli TaxID=2509675 RepID=A0A4P6K5P0_KTERU|nr:excinuclease ABC subunit UvrA [Ktedonosporobacter rubrisoli]